MLVLSRKLKEIIVINGDIRITVVGIGPGRVRIGVEAPQSMTVDRAEVAERKAEEQTSEAA